jgi:hypothetical protein
LFRVEVGIRPDGINGYHVYVKFPGKQPVVVKTYNRDSTTIPPTTDAEARACADAHRLGIVDGMRMTANLIEGMVP